MKTTTCTQKLRMFGLSVSAFWILALNSWMHTPAGFEIADGRAVVTDFWAMVFNPSSMNRLVHVVLGSFLQGAFFVTSISAYYLLSVEQALSDRDGRNHRIDVAVQRRGVTLRSRQAFVLDPTGGRRTPDQSLIESLRSPLGVAGVPLRLTTFIYQDAKAGGKVRIVMAADVKAGTEFESGAPRVLFGLPSAGSIVSTNDLKRFILPVPVELNALPSFNVLLNWTSLLRKR